MNSLRTTTNYMLTLMSVFGIKRALDRRLGGGGGLGVVDDLDER